MAPLRDMSMLLAADTHTQGSVDGASNVLILLQTLNGTNSNHSWRPINYILANNSANVISRDRIYPHLQLGGWQTASVAEHLAANILADRGRAVEHQKHVGQ